MHDDFKYEYMKVMNTITVDSDEIAKRVYEKKQKKHFKIQYIAACFMLTLIGLMAGLRYGNKDNITITVQAAENMEKELGSAPIIIEQDMQNMWGAYYERYDGRTEEHVSCMLGLHCEGDNIKSIAYSVDENDGDIWFSKVDVWDGEQYNDYTYNPLSVPEVYKVFGTHDEGYRAYSGMIKSYTVSYDDQKEDIYSLNITLLENKNGEVTLKKVIIKVDIEFENGAHEKREILVNAVPQYSDSVYCGSNIETSIL